jgi:hypothetical protein
MPERKETPDVLGDLLNVSAAAESAAAPAAPVAKPKPQRKSAKPRAQAKPAAIPAAAPPSSPQPPQWEYREVVFREFRGWRPRYVDGRERWDWKEAPTILEYLRQAGEEGWELVSVGEVHNFQKTAYFKRPKPL